VPQTTFLFWNLNRKPLLNLVAELAHSRRVDVAILAECPDEPGSILQVLNANGEGEFRYPRSVCERVRVFTKFSDQFLVPEFEDDRVSIRRLFLPARSEVLLATAHLPSKLYWSDDSQSFECTRLAGEIARIEDRVEHARTVLVGDLNMNPFESGLAAAGGLNAVMTRNVAARGKRTVQGRAYRYFYNPMWNFFGDMSNGPPGTYYYDGSGHVTYYWNIFDQVLVRPELSHGLTRDDIEIVRAVGTRSLVKLDGTPDAKECSDHLPVVFSLEF
jgi:hypothetical protein